MRITKLCKKNLFNKKDSQCHFLIMMSFLTSGNSLYHREIFFDFIKTDFSAQ